MKTIYLYILDTMADWETGLAIAELNTQRFFKAPQDWQVKSCALTKKPIVTLGGMTIVPDYTIKELAADHAVLLILPGAETWLQAGQESVFEKVQEFLDAGVPVAAICGATGGLAQAGMLDSVKHTSNGLQYLTMFCSRYNGTKNYQDELAVTDGNLITAGSSAQTAFAYHILKKLDVLEPKNLDYWYAYFENHSADNFLKLYQAMRDKKK